MRSAAAAFLALALSMGSPALAEPWEVVVNPYFMVPATSGKFGVGALEASLDTSPGDFFRKLNWAVLGAVEVGNGDIGFGLDVNYINLSIAESEARSASLTGHQAAYTLMAFKRIDPRAEVYVGVKVTDFGLRLRCDAGCPQPLAPPGGTEASRNRSWAEPLVGVRFRDDLSERLDLMVMADIGGFAVGSDFSANVWPQLGYRLGERTRLMLGYRLIYVQYDEGEERERFLFDAVTHGPTLGVEFRF
jgi:hypothetical protein